MTAVLPPRTPRNTGRSLGCRWPLESSQGLAGEVTIDFLTPADWRLLKAVRLAALRDAPHAFVTTHRAERRRPRKVWVDLLTRSRWVLARRDGRIVGIACLAGPDDEGPHARFIESVWVERSQRRQGLVRRMLAELEERAKLDDAVDLQLWVLDTNPEAADAYIKLGFEWVPSRMQNSPKCWLNGKPVIEHLLVRPIWRDDPSGEVTSGAEYTPPR
jgi:ribosomal protein S18 acetylase RimI-like enzyme